jgi:hypothetical protein
MSEEKKPTPPPEPEHQPGTRKGEEMPRKEGKEAGRHEAGSQKAGRPVGKSKGRDSSGVTPKEPEDPKSPNIPTP